MLVRSFVPCYSLVLARVLSRCLRGRFRHSVAAARVISFSFARPPPASSSRLACLNCPPPPGVGCANGRSICGCGRDGGFACFLSYRAALSLRSFAFVSPAFRVFLSCLVSPCLPGRVLFACRRAPSSLRPVSPLPRAFPASSLFSVPASSVWLGRFVVPCLSVCPRLGDSVSVPCHPIGVGFPLLATLRLILSAPPPPRRPSCFAPSRFRAVLVSVLISFRPSPRFACRRAGR